MLNYKKIFAAGLGGVVIISILAPVLILAQTEDVGRRAKGFCALLSTISSKIDQKLIDSTSKLETKRTEISNKISSYQSERDAKLAEKHAKWKDNRAEHFTKLEARAETDEQKQAVTMFTEAVNAAIAVRQEALRTAIQDFRDGINEVIVSRKSSVRAIVDALRNSIKSAIKKAESDCGSDVDQRTVMETLRAELKAARENFVSARKEIPKLATSKELLVTTRKEAIKEANEVFKAAVEQERANLKAAFPQESSE